MQPTSKERREVVERIAEKGTRAGGGGMSETNDQRIYDRCLIRVGELEAENEKLRELVRKYVEYTSQDRCEGCVCKRKCNDGDVDECWQHTEIRELARELGIEVGA